MRFEEGYGSGIGGNRYCVPGIYVDISDVTDYLSILLNAVKYTFYEN